MDEELKDFFWSIAKVFLLIIFLPILELAITALLTVDIFHIDYASAEAHNIGTIVSYGIVVEILVLLAWGLLRSVKNLIRANNEKQRLQQEETSSELNP
jgi:hypothetical protein